MFVRPSSISVEEKESILARFWRKEPALWASQPDAQEEVRNRLGWLDVLPEMKSSIEVINNFVSDVREQGFQRVVILGMGGSSLCPLVMKEVFGAGEGFPELIVLDTTDPDEIEGVVTTGDLTTTLFVVASKSGTTVEPNALFNYFWQLTGEAVSDPGRHFTAITDPGTTLDRLAEERGFCHIFRNPPDIGGRYSALSYFGLVPAALLGLDLERLIERAEDMIRHCGPEVPVDSNPGYQLGEYLGEYGVQSRDKLSILADPAIRPLGLWLEQLIAESTGKETRGLVPIFGETTGIPGFYGGERVFIYIRVKGTPEDESLERFVSELREAEFPVYDLWLDDLYDIAGQFFLWEMATAIACHFIGVNAFDQPDVQAAKLKTGEVLDAYRSEGRMPISFWVDPQSNINYRPSKILAPSMKSLSRALRDIFTVLPSWGYLAFLPYLPYDSEVDEIIGSMRYMVRQEKGCATTMGYGPRYLHSTGQIHKGGPYSAAFLIFTRKRKKDYPTVPGFQVSFWHMQFAQAVGDFEVLSEAGKRAVLIHLPDDYRLGLTTFSKVLARAVRL